MIEDENKKKKLVLSDKKIKTTRKFDINHLAFTKCGNYIATSGKNQDTEIQIFDGSKACLIDTVDTNEIQNIELKFTPCDNYLTISTYMYEIVIVQLKKTEKFNKAISGYETSVKVNYIFLFQKDWKKQIN